MAESPERILSVSELNGHLKAVVEATFPPLWVAGEISDLAKPRSGHMYFTLKDEDSQIRGVIWRSTAARIPFDLTDGQAVLCYGGLEVYPPRGTYQIVVRKVQPQGVGALQLAFDQLRTKLQAEGLFAAERKRDLPVFPARIAVITSPTGAAIADFLQAASARYRGTEILIVPAQVQGVGATPSILAALDAVDAMSDPPDAVVLTRGGGSLEDLWCFNDEAVVRRVADFPLPTVSAIGHEIDVTLCDLVADVRALTPTDAATKVLPDANALAGAIAGWRERLSQRMLSQIREHRLRLDGLSKHSVLKSPMEFLHHRSRILDELDSRGRVAMERRLQAAERRVATAASSLHALSPLAVLGRGYSLTYGPDGNPMTDATSVKPGDVIRTRLSEGHIESTVQSINDAK
ncbi:exodeoxyribonuclease VII large subunit [Crateriforma spongiae]|uniref:exodeoxyribonuclease VII large subunit n=1 Tax=Crateriforma spongiae TaxID=2724528 RepID=UPI001445FE46|nr:exodeoxyribonuclease VII large subunit [Crateriforma spongiae]